MKVNYDKSFSASAFATLPSHVCQGILAFAGSGGPAAAMSCKALLAIWRSTLTVAPLGARYLLSRYGPVTAARHVYALSQHSQLLHGAGAAEQDGIMLELLRQLYRAGAELPLHDALLLMQAARAGHSKVVSELIQIARPSTFALSRSLSAAAEAGHVGIARQLLQAGAPPAAYQSATLAAAAAGGSADMANLLCAAGADPTADGSAALRRAVQLGHVECATALLRQGADPSARCSAALLHACGLPAGVAAAAGQPHRGDGFRGRNDKPRCGDDCGDDCGDGDGEDGEGRVLDLVEVLLRAGADARAHGRPALEAAAARGYGRVVRTLLAAGADPAACNSCALVAASIQGHTDVVGLLLESGADPWDVTDLALRTASERGHRPVLQAIRQAQRAASSTAEGSLGSGGSATAGSGGGGGGIPAESGTPRRGARGLGPGLGLAAAAARWSVSPDGAAAMGGRWSLQSTIQSEAAAATALMMSGGVAGGGGGGGGGGMLTMDGAAMEAFLSNL